MSTRRVVGLRQSSLRSLMEFVNLLRPKILIVIFFNFTCPQMQTEKQDRILVMGATNRPSDLDTAALRRFPKRIHVGLPDLDTRVMLVSKLLHSHAHSLTQHQIRDLGRRTEGYSGSDLNSLATEAAYGPIREKSIEDLKIMTKNSIRPINYEDFITSLSQIKVTPPKDLVDLENWNRMYGANS